MLKRCAADLNAYAEYVVATVKGRKFHKPVLNAACFDHAFLKVLRYVQSCNFGAAIEMLIGGSPANFEFFVSQ